MEKSSHVLLKIFGALVTAQKTHGVDDQTIALTESWQATVWDQNIEANRNFARHDQVSAYESAMPRGEGWVGSWPLGSGSFGKTHLFVQQNSRGQICNRIVVKDCDHDRTDGTRKLWAAKWFWLKDHRDRAIPVEVKTMSDLRGKIGSESIVKIMSWCIVNERKLYRLYLEVSTHGSPSCGWTLTVLQYVKSSPGRCNVALIRSLARFHLR